MFNVVVSSCGTSLLTNDQPRDLLDRIKEFSNAREDEIPGTVRLELERAIESRKAKLFEASLPDARKLSAELNGLIGFYGENLGRVSGDLHFLIHTDTWLGEKAASILKEWLEWKGLSCQCVRIRDLATRDIAGFQAGMSELAKWMDETLAGYQENQNWHVVFNLSGGFKSVNGFMQIFGMFYADELVYIFEMEKALLRIPRLPVEIEEGAFRAIENHLAAARKLGWGSDLDAVEAEGLPGAMLLELDGRVSFSPWGEILFSRFKKKAYTQRVYPSPLEKLRFGPRFEKSLAGLSPDRIAKINERIDDLCRSFETGQVLKRADFKQIKGTVGVSTHELYAWSDEAARRLFLHQEGDVWVLDELGDHL